MSYIRSTSNPEAIYIWSEGKEVTIMKGSEIVGKLPTKVMNGLIKKYIINNCPDECNYLGAKISEEWVESNPMVAFSYKNWKVTMWDVTWYYIAHSNVIFSPY